MLELYEGELQNFPWPAESPDLNIFERVSEVSEKFADRGCRVVSATDSSAVNSVFLTGVATFSFILLWPLWSNGQSSWLQILRSRVRFPGLPDYLRNSGSGAGFTQPSEDN
jgi:hypothetical protein